MDKLTVKIMSYACKMADITDEGVSCENLSVLFFYVWILVLYDALLGNNLTGVIHHFLCSG